MKILGIETSCDETGAAVIEADSKNQPVRLIANSLATSLEAHALTGGVIPERAAREQVKFIIPVIKEALNKAGLSFKSPEIDAIAVTYGPGLIGSLLVGVETAKTLSYLWNIPIIPVNHLYGHIYANWIKNSKINDPQIARLTLKESRKKSTEIHSDANLIPFPAVALVVSGGHTDLVYIKKHGNLKVIGGTRDDAAGEAFDKIGRLMGLPYPAGPLISRLAEKGNHNAFLFPRPMWNSNDFDFSFSGLKTSVLNLIKKNNWKFDNENSLQNKRLIEDISSSVEKAIIDILVFKTMNAVKEYEVKTLLLGGGVAANKALRDEFRYQSAKSKVEFFVPQSEFCTDNAAMIAAAGYYNDNKVSWSEVTADPELYY